MQTIFSHFSAASCIAYHSTSPRLLNLQLIPLPLRTCFFPPPLVARFSLSKAAGRTRSRSTRHQPRLVTPFHGTPCGCEDRRERIAGKRSGSLQARLRESLSAVSQWDGCVGSISVRSRQPVIVDNEILTQCMRNRRSYVHPTLAPLSFRERYEQAGNYDSR